MLKGIDVSHWNGFIDFEQFVKSEFSDFMIIKATQGSSYIDGMFDINIARCVEYNILTGMYHFVNKEDWREQVKNFLFRYDSAVICGSDPLLVLDVEEDGVEDLADKELQDMIYCMVADIYAETGIYPLIYCSTFFRSQHFFDNVSYKCAGWIARYNIKKPAARKDLNIAIHQFTSSGKVEGIKGDVDLNKAYLTREAWYRLAGKK